MMVGPSNMDMWISNIMRLGALPKMTDYGDYTMGAHRVPCPKRGLETCDPGGHFLTPWNHEK